VTVIPVVSRGFGFVTFSTGARLMLPSPVDEQEADEGELKLTLPTLELAEVVVVEEEVRNPIHFWYRVLH